MGQLGDQLRLDATAADQLDSDLASTQSELEETSTDLAEANARIVVLTGQLADCEDGTPPPDPPTSTLQLVYSKTANRANPLALNGAAVAGPIYVFTRPDTGITSMTFALDGEPARVEANAPFDFAGGTAAAANPLATTTLAEGVHQIVADPEPGVAVAASFIVDNQPDVPVPPDPPPVVNEPYPALEGTPANPSTIDAVLAATPPRILLENGLYPEFLTGRLRPGQIVMAREPGKAIFRAAGTGATAELLKGVPAGVKLWGLGVENYLRINVPWTHSVAATAVIDAMGGTNVEIGWCKFKGTDITFVRWAGGWYVHDTDFQEAHTYAMAGGGKTGTKRAERITGRWLGTLPNGAEAKADSNRGFCKFAVTKFVTVDDITLRDCWQGVWWDIANENFELKNFDMDRIDRTGANIEINYGPGKVHHGIIRHAALNRRASEPVNWGAPGGVVLSLSPDNEVYEVVVEDTRNGITAIQWNHPGLHQNPNAPGPSVTDPSRLGIQNNLIHDCEVRGATQNAYGYTGSSQSPPAKPTVNNVWRDSTYDGGNLAGGTMINVTKV